MKNDFGTTSSSRNPVISLMLGVADISAAMEWYKRALGASEMWRMGIVASLQIEGAPFLLAQPECNGWDTPEEIGTTTVRVEVFCDDPDQFVARALEAGATGSLETIENHQRPWGIHRQGGFTDPFGHIWVVGDKSPLRQNLFTQL